MFRSIYGYYRGEIIVKDQTPKNNYEKDEYDSNRTINIALAGNPNVGKSVIFNQLTGLSQTIGNWPGKTVEKLEGHLDSMGYHFNIVDLPGIYSLSTYSLEEIVSREYIVDEEVDLIINVIDATNLERNLFLTFQLLELKVPIILALNQMDILRKRNIELDFEKLRDIFKVPVLPVVAVHGIGVHELLKHAIEIIEERTASKFEFPDLSEISSFGKEIETKIQTIINEIKNNYPKITDYNYPARFLAIKMLEKDEEILKLINTNEKAEPLLTMTNQFITHLEDYHGEDMNSIISSEIYHNIHQIVEKVIEFKKKKEMKRRNIADKIDHLTTHSFWGYIILFLVIFGIYAFTFVVGDFLGTLIDDVYSLWSESIYNLFGEETLLIKIFWDGGIGGFIGAVAGVLVYVIPFFLTIEILQDSGYLPRAAFLMDKIMHVLGVHGKTIIPMILGFGCNVPACSGCRIMETKREKKISIALTSLIPCAAVMTVVFGLVGRFLGLGWVLLLFSINFLVILIVGKILNKTMPGTCTELIMEMHEYRKPNYKVILKQTWLRSKEFIFKALPIIIIFGISLEIFLIFNILEPVNAVLEPITFYWLGLPAITGVFLIYGIIRKELTLTLLALFAESQGIALAALLSPIQMITFSLVTMLYIPCFATIIVIAKQTSWKYALQITALEISLALLIGGIINFGYIFITEVL
ncbi:MAG: ferrous iron transport protein B [Promethearchaeota archaeon]|nr:MAG: ferrous iron transport protein B [Candidatus Lokiarchaeota archaeon]